MFSPKEFVVESNRIEGIHRDPLNVELEEFSRFMNLEFVTIGDLQKFVGVYQPHARLRDREGLNVVVGRHFPPQGGEAVPAMLQALLDDVNEKDSHVYAHQHHMEYERIHPFTDGNGRSGRMLWAWEMGELHALTLGFLHRFYYQTLDASQS